MSCHMEGGMIWCLVCKHVYGAWDGDAGLEDLKETPVCCDRSEFDSYDLHQQINYLAVTAIGALQDVAIANNLQWDERTKRGVVEYA